MKITFDLNHFQTFITPGKLGNLKQYILNNINLTEQQQDITIQTSMSNFFSNFKFENNLYNHCANDLHLRYFSPREKHYLSNSFPALLDKYIDKAIYKFDLQKHELTQFTQNDFFNKYPVLSKKFEKLKQLRSINGGSK